MRACGEATGVCMWLLRVLRKNEVYFLLAPVVVAVACCSEASGGVLPFIKTFSMSGFHAATCVSIQFT